MDENKYRRVKSPINSTLTVVQDNEYQWGVIDENGNIVVPFGRYAWIDGFQNGLAKVIGHNDTTSPNIVATLDDDWNIVPMTKRISEQGIINETGEEVLPLKYNVWKFYGKDFHTIKYFDGDETFMVRFEELNPDLISEKDDYEEDDSKYDFDDDRDYKRDTWDALTDGQYGDMPDDFDGDYSFLGY